MGRHRRHHLLGRSRQADGDPALHREPAVKPRSNPAALQGSRSASHPELTPAVAFPLHFTSTISIAIRSGPSIIAARIVPHGWISSRNFTPSRFKRATLVSRFDVLTAQ